MASMVNGWNRCPVMSPLPGTRQLQPPTRRVSWRRGSDGGTIFKAFLDGHNDADLDADAMPDGAELWSNMIRGHPGN